MTANTDFRLPTVDRRLPTAGYRLPATDCRNTAFSFNLILLHLKMKGVQKGVPERERQNASIPSVHSLHAFEQNRQMANPRLRQVIATSSTDLLNKRKHPPVGNRLSEAMFLV